MVISPACAGRGNVLNQSLDSGFRRNDDWVLFWLCVIPACLRGSSDWSHRYCGHCAGGAWLQERPITVGTSAIRPRGGRGWRRAQPGANVSGMDETARTTGVAPAPACGKRKLWKVLCRDQGFTLSISTVGRILKHLVARGRVRPAAFYMGQVKPKRRVSSHTTPGAGSTA